jgi:hypothetical protein
MGLDRKDARVWLDRKDYGLVSDRKGSLVWLKIKMVEQESIEKIVDWARIERIIF